MTLDKTLRLAPLLVMLLFTMGLALGLFKSDPTRYDHRALGKPIGQFQIEMMNDSASKFSPALWQNHVALINVFASWCEPCQTEHEVLMNLSKTGKVAIFGIAWKDQPEKVAPWIAASGNPYQAIGIDTYGDATMALALTGVPETLIVDTQGIIRYHRSTPLTDDIVDTTILPLVEELSQADNPPASR